MEIQHKYFLIEEVLVHCNFSLSGFRNMKLLIEDVETRQIKDVWAYLQLGLAHAAIVSAYLYSKQKSAKTRIEFLQENLKPAKTSPLTNKLARNYLEHIDENFDYWINNKSDFSGLIEMVFPNRKAFEYLSKSKYFVRRAIIQDELIFLYQKNESLKEFEIQPIITELESLTINGNSYLNNLEQQNDSLFFIRP